MDSRDFDPRRFEVIEHPLVQHKLSILRDKDTGTKQFRELVTELAVFEGYEAMRDFPLEDVEVDTPLERTTCKRIAGKKVAIIPILRAGLGMVDGILTLTPSARASARSAARPRAPRERHTYCVLRDHSSVPRRTAFRRIVPSRVAPSLAGTHGIPRTRRSMYSPLLRL